MNKFSQLEGQQQKTKYLCHWSPQTKGEREGTEKVLKRIMAENFPNFTKDINLKIPEAECILNRLNLKNIMPRLTMIKLPKLKIKEKSWNHHRETKAYRGNITYFE